MRLLWIFLPVTCNMSEPRAERNLSLPYHWVPLKPITFGFCKDLLSQPCGFLWERKNWYQQTPWHGLCVEDSSKLLLTAITKHLPLETHRESGSREDGRACLLWRSGCEERCIFSPRPPRWAWDCPWMLHGRGWFLYGTAEGTTTLACSSIKHEHQLPLRSSFRFSAEESDSGFADDKTQPSSAWVSAELLTVNWCLRKRADIWCWKCSVRRNKGAILGQNPENSSYRQVTPTRKKTLSLSPGIKRESLPHLQWRHTEDCCVRRGDKRLRKMKGQREIHRPREKATLLCS